MKKQTISICALMLALAAIMNVTARANAFTKVNYPKILKAEYAGKELSKDIQNPTILPLLSKEIPITLIGNDACESLSDFLIFESSQNGTANSYNTQFDGEGICVYYIKEHLELYVNNEVFDYYWGIIDTSDYRSGLCSTGIYIEGSESPTYYITFNAGASEYIPPQGGEPEIVRVELNGKELSKDKNNPTTIPLIHNLKIYGNSACISKTESVIPKYNGKLAYHGALTRFNTSAEAPYSLSPPTVLTGDNDIDQYYDKDFKMELLIRQNINGKQIYSKTPVYYIHIPGEDSINIDVAAGGLLRLIKLSEDRLIIETGQNYILGANYMTFIDTTDGKKYLLQPSDSNPDYIRVNANRHEFINLPLNKDHAYALTIPKWAIYYQTGADFDDINNYNHNKEYKTVLKIGDELAFGENNPGQEVISFIERVISFILTFFIASR